MQQRHLKVATKGSPWIQFTLTPTHYGKYDSFSELKNPPLPIKMWELQRESNIGNLSTHQILDPLDKLIEQHPDLPWLIAMRLRQTVVVFNRNRQGGDFADVRNYEEIQKGKPSIERNDNEINYTPQQMRETLALCRQGEKLEPQNAYFTWLRVYFLMSNWQDEEAFKAMNEAASKTYFNNYYAEYYQHYADATKDILGRPLTAYETMSVANAPLEFGYNAQMREMARILSWQGVKMRRAGDNAKAVVFLANTYHVMTMAMQGDSKPIDFYVDYAIALIISASPLYPAKYKKSKQHRDKQQLQAFIAYMNKYHRNDLAQQFEKDWNVNQKLFTQTRSYFGKADNFRSYLALAQSADIFLRCTVLTILSIAGALFAWVLLGIYYFRKSDKSTFGEPAIQSSVQYKGIFACSGIAAFLLAILFLALVVSIKDTIIPTDFGWGWGALGIFQTSIHDKSLIDIIDIIDILSNTGNISSYPTFWRLLVFFTPVICGALFALFHSRGEQQKSTFRQKISRNTYLALLFLAWGIIALTSQYEPTQTILAAICDVFLLLSFLRVWWQTKGNTGHTIAMFRASLAGWICTGSVLVLLLLIGQSVINHQIQSWANNQLRGEMHLLHQVKNSAP